MRNNGKSTNVILSLLYHIKSIGVEMWVENDIVMFKPPPPVDLMMIIGTMTKNQKKQMTELVREINKEKIENE